MALRTILAISAFVAPVLSSAPAQAPIVEYAGIDFGPQLSSARDNAPEVFNAIHAAMRQWGGSLKHNGMSFFTASIPNNTLLYHGTHSEEPVIGMEWLAFEIEHAEVFARSRGPGGGGPGGRPGGPGRGPPGGRPPGGGYNEPGNGRGPPPGGHEPKDHFDAEADSNGYLQIYRTTRTLSKILYLDGMSAGKTSMGTLDTQDFVMRNESDTQDPNGLLRREDSAKVRAGGPFGDYQRAQNMCALGVEHGIEGIIRMEAGFELILCDFTNGLQFVSAMQRPKYNVSEGYSDLAQFEYVRGVAARYHGITNNRVKVDYSSMVSAFFYPMNLTNPDPSRSDLPRLVNSTLKARTHVKEDVLDLFSESNLSANREESIDWQGVVDMIVSRYSDRLQLIASENSTKNYILSEFNFLLNVFVDYADPSTSAAIEKCTSHYLNISPTTPSDHLVFAAIESVSHEICSTLFAARNLVLGEETRETEAEHARNTVRGLIKYLDWSTWLECGKCAYDEVCFVAIWPWGGSEDHVNPGCVKNEGLRDRRGYWDWGH